MASVAAFFRARLKQQDYAGERLRVSDVECIVKLETNLQSLEKGQERIEHALEKMDADQAAGRAEIVATIREMSKREIK